MHYSWYIQTIFKRTSADNTVTLRYAHVHHLSCQQKWKLYLPLQDTETVLRTMLATQGKKVKCLFWFGSRMKTSVTCCSRGGKKKAKKGHENIIWKAGYFKIWDLSLGCQRPHMHCTENKELL